MSFHSYKFAMVYSLRLLRSRTGCENGASAKGIQYMETDILPLDEDESFHPMRFWNDRYSTQPDLARMALDALAVTAGYVR
jgi:hypothetical protein